MVRVVGNVVEVVVVSEDVFGVKVSDKIYGLEFAVLVTTVDHFLVDPVDGWGAENTSVARRHVSSGQVLVLVKTVEESVTSASYLALFFTCLF